MMTTKRLLNIGFILTFLTTVTLRANEIQLDKIAAVVNDDIIMVSQVRSTANQLKLVNNTSTSDQVLINEALNRLILEKVQLQKAQAIGITVDNTALNQAMLTLAQQNKLSLQEFRKALIREGHDYKVFRESIRDKITIDIIQKAQKSRSLDITESETDDLILSETDNLNKGTQYQLIDIYIPASKTISISSFNLNQQKAQSLRSKLLKNAKQLTSKSSQLILKRFGAEIKHLNWQSVQALSSNYRRALSLIGKGEYSGIIRDHKGFHILKVLGKKGGLQKTVQHARVRHILIPSTKNKALITQLRNKIIAGANFTKLASQYSADTGSAKNGGELGMMSPDNFVPPFANAVKTLPLNVLSQPLKTRFGWHIVEVLERKTIDQTRQALKKQAKNQLIEKNSSAKFNNWLQGLRDEAFIEYRI